ncbi:MULTISPECIES: carboxypeptidase regulatory-like domain-containing protein [unclassified Modestobacter]
MSRGVIGLAPQPSLGRVASLLWFPFFFVATMSVLFSLAFAHPQPHGVPVGLVVAGADGDRVEDVLRSSDGAFVPRRLEDPVHAERDVAEGRLAGALTCGPPVVQDAAGECRVLTASAANRARASYVTDALQEVARRELGVQAGAVDAAPLSPGDSSGAGLFFYAFPLAMVGMVTSIVLLQLSMWSTVKKLAAIAAVGVFASVVTYAVAVVRDVLPADPALLPAGFLVVQSIAWVITAAATYVRQYLLPVALTFVLVLGVPTSAGTVAADMLPSYLGLLHEGMPLGAFVDLVRASAYGIGTVGRPLAVLVAWVAVGAVLMACAHRSHQRRHLLAAVAAPTGPAMPLRHTLSGRVTNLSGGPVEQASVTVLDESGREVEQALADGEGNYLVLGVSAGLHHLIATARHCEPVIVTVTVDAGPRESHHDLRLQDWRDPAGNLTVGEVG